MEDKPKEPLFFDVRSKNQLPPYKEKLTDNRIWKLFLWMGFHRFVLTIGEAVEIRVSEGFQTQKIYLDSWKIFLIFYRQHSENSMRYGIHSRFSIHLSSHLSSHIIEVMSLTFNTFSRKINPNIAIANDSCLNFCNEIAPSGFQNFFCSVEVPLCLEKLQTHFYSKWS